SSVAFTQTWPIAPVSNGRHSLHTISQPARFPSRLSACHLASRAFHTSLPRGADEVISVNAPSFADSVSEGDIRWEKAVGDSVSADELVGEIETDKTNKSVEYDGLARTTMLSSGQVQEWFTNPALGQLCDQTRQAKTGGAKPAASSPPPAAEAAAPPPPPPKDEPAPAQAVPPPIGGPIPSALPPVGAPPSAPMTSTPVAAVKPQPAASLSVAPSIAGHVSGTRAEQRVKMNRMRQRIAQRLKDAQNTAAMLTTFNEIDMSNVMEMRNKYKDAFLKKHNLKLGFMSAFVKAAAFALQDQPVVNAVIDDLEIVYRDYIDISVAVATPKGLVVPVIRNVEQMNYADIEKTIAELGEKARAGTLAIEDMDGGTFTISNGGVFGSMFGTPIINPPQSAILGMHGIFERPVAISGKVEIRPMMYVALTYDHKLVDGREAVTFLRKIKGAVEDPRIMLLDL
ncbi:dihydrolipoyllysine-residue succinyltransferase component of 2-oxoglutarate dehydrogenase complex, partial [Elysia marginata]